MAAISNVVPPATRFDPLKFDLVAGQFFGSGQPSWNVEVVLAIGEDNPLQPRERVVVWQRETLQPRWADHSTVTGAGTVASPLHFQLLPASGQWERGRQMKVLVDATDVPQAVESSPVYPNSYALAVDCNTYRQFGNYVAPFLTNVAANSADRTTIYAHTQLGDMLQDPFHAPTVATSTANKAAATSVAGSRMPWFPGMRVGVVYPLGGETGVMSINKWVDPVHWQICANALSIILAMRNSDDPRVVIDAESYGADALEAGVESLAGIGKTVADLRTAMQPFVDVLLAANAVGVGVVVLTHPNVLNGINEVPVYLLDRLGPKRVHMQGEVTFQGDNRLRVCPVVDPNLTSYSQIKANHQQMRSELEAYCGAGPLIVIPVVDNYYWQDCGRLQRERVSEISSHGVWVFDDLRGTFSDSPYPSTDQRDLYGTADFRTMYSSHSTNRRAKHWRWPGGTALTTPVSVGTSATPTNGLIWTSTTQSSMSVGGNGIVMDVNGWKLVPMGGNIYSCARIEALPTGGGQNFSVFERYIMPATLGGIATPITGVSRTNVGHWQIYVGADGNLYFQGATGEGAGGVGPKLLKTAYALGVEHKLCIVRAGATTWRFKVDGDAVINHTHSTTLGTDPELQVGGGEEPATFHTNNKIQSCAGIILMEASGEFTAWSSAEMDAANGSDDYPIHRST